MPNVILGNADMDNFALVSRSTAIIATTGTAGLEGIVLGKRVGVLGRPYYSVYKGVSELNYPEDMTLYFTGLMSSALMFNAISLDMSGKRIFCSPRSKMHKVEEHIQITNWYITNVGDTMRSEYRKMGRNFDEIEISEAYALALMTYYSCD